MFSQYFNHGQLRRYMAAFGSFFDDIQIRRNDSTGAEQQRFVVPIDFSAKEPWLVRLKADPNLQKGTAIVVPRMAYEVTGISYDGARKLNTLNHTTFPSPQLKRLAKMYVGVPYTLNIDLNILSRTHEDALQVVEQVLPYFTPDLTFKLIVIPEVGYRDQIALTLVGTSQNDTYEQDFMTRRAIVWTLSFTMPVYFYGPIKHQSRIEEVLVDIHTVSDTHPPVRMETEDLLNTELEDGSGEILDESSSELTQRDTQVRIDAVAAPNQIPEPGPNVIADVTITESDIEQS